MKRIKLIVNCSTLQDGGALQVGRTIINTMSDDPRLVCMYVLSKPLYNSMPSFELSNINYIVLNKSPARSIKMRKKMKRVEFDFLPEIVYSVGFPSYVKFRTIEVGRYTNPWEINEGYLPWDVLPNLKTKVLYFFGMLYRQHWSKNADYIETQTQSAKRGIVKRVGIQSSNIFVLPNVVNEVFYKTKKNRITSCHASKIFCLAAAYPHKNLTIIPIVAAILKNKYNFKGKFYITIKKDGGIYKDIYRIAIELGVDNLIHNLGPISLDQCVKYYNKCKIVFQPSLLEVFSATYLESMIMGRPLVVPNLPFAKNVCGDSALYYHHDSADEAAKCIYKLISDSSLYTKIAKLSERRADLYPKPVDKQKEIVEILLKLSNKHN